LASQINASNSGFGGIVSTGDSSGQLQLQTAATTALTIDTSQNTTLAGKLTTASSGIQFSDASTQTAAASPYVLKNRIINGAMQIDQRNAGAAQTITSGSTVYTVDRWIGYFGGGNGTAQRVGSVGAYSLQFTGGAGVSGWQCIQRIESYNIVDLANQTVTLSFTVSSSTQTSVGLFYNTPTAQDNFSSLNSTGTISGGVTVTSTPTRQSLTFTMPSNATNGFQFFFQLGSFTSGTFTITNVQLEVGSSATPFERRLYNQELANCQRYYYKISGASTDRIALGHNSLTTASISTSQFPVTLRTAPTALEQSGTATHYDIQHANTSTVCSAVPTFLTASINMATSTFTVASGLTAGQGSNARLASTSGYLAWSAEL
jgi:hypothetical protein